MDLGTQVVGSAQLTTTGNISGFEIFRWNTFDQEASVPSETRTPNRVVLVFDNTNGLTTEVGLASLSGSAATIMVTLRDDTGAPLPSMSVDLPAREHKSFMLPDPASENGGVRGAVGRPDQRHRPARQIRWDAAVVLGIASVWSRIRP